jgi:hypothetical protein
LPLIWRPLVAYLLQLSSTIWFVIFLNAKQVFLHYVLQDPSELQVFVFRPFDVLKT